MKASKLCLYFSPNEQGSSGFLTSFLFLVEAKELNIKNLEDFKKAIWEKKIFFASKQIALENLNQESQELYQNLKYFLAPTHFVSTFLTSSIELSQLRFETKKIFFMDSKINQPELSMTRDLYRYTDESLRDVEVTKYLSESLQKKKMLLHICCGPDAAGVINQLKRDYEVLCFWYDPNIQPKEEHDKRLEAFKQVAEIENVPYVIGEYDVDRFFESIKGLEHTPEQGAKCSSCYDMRLDRAAREALVQECDLYTTTLAISPHKVQQKLKNFGELNEEKYNIRYYTKNFMKDEGFKKSVEYTTEYNIYRQDYCGCYYSLYEGGPAAKAQAEKIGLSHCDTQSVEKFKQLFINQPQVKETTS